MAAAAAAFVPPKTLRDVPRGGDAYGAEHPALIVPAVDGQHKAFTVTYAALEANLERCVCCCGCLAFATGPDRAV